MVVTWNGKGAVSVSLPKTYSGKVSGLCGDCNGKRDDFRTATGEDVRSKKNKFALIGNSYMLKGKSDMSNAKYVIKTTDLKYKMKGIAKYIHFCCNILDISVSVVIVINTM
jgi:hypothetical protein